MDAVDIAVSVAFVGISSFIGIYYAYKDRKNASIDNYFLAGRSANPIALGMSLLVTYSSSVSFISWPAESYIVGTEFLWTAIARFVAIIPATIYFIPAFRRLDTRSFYEFLELRYSKVLRRVAAFFGVIPGLFYAGIVVYVTASTLSVVAGIPNDLCIVITTIFCVFYTSLGGMKAVVWTDAAQFLFMVAGLLAMFIRGMNIIGGFENLSSALGRGDRYNMWRFDYGFISRVSPWARILGNFAASFQVYAISQQSIQRYQSCKTTSQARWASTINMVGGCLMTLGIAGVGYVSFALFESCDPVRSGQIRSVDQITPFTAIYLLSDIPGMIGLYVAALFSAALSTVSSTINSLGIVIIEEFLCLFWKRLKKSERLKLSIGKLVVIVLGAIVMGMAFLSSYSKSNIVQLLTSFTGLITGPVVGLYILGFFCPSANSKGGTAGFSLSLSFGLFMFIGYEFFKIPYHSTVPPTFTYGCPHNNITTSLTTAVAMTTNNVKTSSMETEHSALQDLFNLNFNMITVFGILITVIFGYLISFITGPSDPSKCNPKLFIPLVDHKHLPSSVRTIFRFGVPDENVWEKNMEISTTILEDKL